MLVLPIPLVVALGLGLLLLRLVLRGDRPWPFAALIGACVVQGTVVSFAQHYGVTPLRFVQPVTATVIPALAWVTFQASAVRRFKLARDLPHLITPALTLFCLLLVPAALDLAVVGAFLIYGTAILLALRAGTDGLPLTRLETGHRPGLIWGAVALTLIGSGISDGMISLALLAGYGWLQPVIISVFSSLSLGFIGALALSQSLAGPERQAEQPLPPAAALDETRTAEIMGRLNTLIMNEKLYLDADLTLERLSRKLLVPAKQLSAAINRTTGENVSRYVNALRIEHACQRLKAGDNVTTAMLSSGFNTKSNFNREFLRLRGCSPKAWLTQNSE